MRDSSAMLDQAVRAFQETTGVPAEGSVTRARVLARAARQFGRRRMLRRAAGLVPGLLVFLSLGTAAWTAGFHWRAPMTVAVDGPAETPRITRGVAEAPRRTIPPMPERPIEVEVDPWRAESRAYARAHQAHFVDDDPARALAGWDAYLRRYPRGTFAPEARFNRALSLIRVGRHDEAATTLGAIARDRASDYHHPDACALLRWLGRRASRRQAELPEPDCFE